MIENTDKMVAAILAAARYQKSAETSAKSIVGYYDECLALLLAPRDVDAAKAIGARDDDSSKEHLAFRQHDRDYGGG